MNNWDEKYSGKKRKGTSKGKGAGYMVVGTIFIIVGFFVEFDATTKYEDIIFALMVGFGVIMIGLGSIVELLNELLVYIRPKDNYDQGFVNNSAMNNPQQPQQRQMNYNYNTSQLTNENISPMNRVSWCCPKCKKVNKAENNYCYFCNTSSPYSNG